MSIIVSSEELLTLQQKYQQSKGEYRVYSARLMAVELICIKQVLFVKEEGAEARLLRSFLKGVRERKLLCKSSCDIHRIFHLSTQFDIVHLLDPFEEANRSLRS